MIDKIGRNIDYIRISVTDRCNLRCIYCMPEVGVESIPHSKILSFDDIIRVCTVLAKDGLKKIKLTGGEPLVRKGIVNLVRELKGIDGIESVTITTNGVLLEEYYDALVQAGIDAITVSLDTL
ncbi:MAG: radical SAM protein, partial [Oscillospiraceae bacterium]